MINSPRSVSGYGEELVIHLPHPIILRIVARSVLLAAAILSFPWLRIIVQCCHVNAVAAAAAEPKWVDDPFSLPMLVSDLKRQGFLISGATALFLGDAGSRLAFLEKNRIRPVSEFGKLIAKDRSVDFVLAADGLTGPGSSFGFVDRVVKVGGVVVVCLAGSFRLPWNYRVAYIRRFGATFVGIKKTFNANAGELGPGTGCGRRLLSVTRSKTEITEQEATELCKPKYLADPMGENSLVDCPKRIFVHLRVAERKVNLEWLGTTSVGIKKTFRANADGLRGGTGRTQRLLSVMRSKVEAMENMEDAFLDLPEEELKAFKPKYLPHLMGDNSLVDSPNRPFVNLQKAKRTANLEWLGDSFMGIKKTFCTNTDESRGGKGRTRRLLSVTRSKAEAMEELEDAFLEPPEEEELKVYKRKYLPDLMGDNSLAGYPKRVFIDVSDKVERSTNVEWFLEEYPKKGAEFETVKVGVTSEGEGISEWLMKNVREEEFVVMKAEATVVEEMVREGAIGLVDELLLECKSEERAYWECLRLFGMVRGEGVAVHQWWREWEK